MVCLEGCLCDPTIRAGGRVNAEMHVLFPFVHDMENQQKVKKILVSWNLSLKKRQALPGSCTRQLIQTTNRKDDRLVWHQQSWLGKQLTIIVSVRELMLRYGLV